MTYQEILKSVDYPEDILVVDFETYFDTYYSLKKMSTIEYIMDERFEVTGLGWKGEQTLNDESVFPCAGFWALVNILEEIERIPWDKFTIVVANAKFDITILKEKFGIIPKYIIDIQDLARHYDSRMSHHLKDLANMFGLKPKGDTMQFKGLHYADMTGEQRKALADYCATSPGSDCENTFEIFKHLLPLLSNPKIELALARHTLNLYLEPQFNFDFNLADILEIKMRAKIDGAAEQTGLTKTQLSSNIHFVDILAHLLVDEEVPLKIGKPSKGMIELLNQLYPYIKDGVVNDDYGNHSYSIPALAKDDDGCKWLLAHPNQEVRELMQARQVVKSWPLHIKRIQNMARQAKASGGKLRVPLHYYGGHTGRWSGGEKINLQNLGGRGRTGTGIDPLISQMRNLLRG